MSQPDWISEMLDQLGPDLRESYEERAAIMQFDGGLTRDHAECLALLAILRRNPSVLRPENVRKEGDLI
jgi:hypothetical protein